MKKVRNLDKIELMDNYVIQHFRIAFGNRIVSHMKKFVPVYVACGGDEVDGVDYYIARKILRKFEQLNLAYIRDEIDGFIKFLDKEFGKELHDFSVTWIGGECLGLDITDNIFEELKEWC